MWHIKDNFPIRKRKIFQSEKGKKNIQIRERKIFQLGNGKYFQSELVNWEMAEEETNEQEDEK